MNGGYSAEVLLGTVIGERFQELEDLNLVLEDGLGPLFVVVNGLIKNLDQSADAINFDELSIKVPSLIQIYFSAIYLSMLPKCILIAVSLLSSNFNFSSSSFFLFS